MPLQSELRDVNPPGVSKTTDYMLTWVIRSHMFADLRARRISKVEMDEVTTVKDVETIFPDSGRWLTELARAHAIATVSDVADLLGYTHPPELLTRFCCIFGDQTVLCIPPEYLTKNAIPLKKLRAEIFQKTGVVPVPALLLMQYQSSSQSVQSR